MKLTVILWPLQKGAATQTFPHICLLTEVFSCLHAVVPPFYLLSPVFQVYGYSSQRERISLNWPSRKLSDLEALVLFVLLFGSAAWRNLAVMWQVN